MKAINRRQFLLAVAVGATAAARGDKAGAPCFDTRGVVLVPEDFSLHDWPERAHRAGLTTLALHHARSVAEVVRFVKSDTGQDALDRARKLGLEIEYELHAMSDLLPRQLFEKDKSLFRMNEKGERVPDSNLCVHSPHAQEIVVENAVAFAHSLRPTTSRYFYWGDDGRPWCHCPKCHGLSDSEQALVLENALLKALRRDDPQAQLSHLAYAGTIKPPLQVTPDSGVFLEYAPIQRRYDVPYAQQMDGRDGLANLEANLKIFPVASAQVLEYWLDVSRFSGWTRPAKKLPWNHEVFLADLETYAARGIRHITTFAVFIDADYVKMYGQPEEVRDYGDSLQRQVDSGRPK
jgi:hypothetical protein